MVIKISSVHMGWASSSDEILGWLEEADRMVLEAQGEQLFFISVGRPFAVV